MTIVASGYRIVLVSLWKDLLRPLVGGCFLRIDFHSLSWLWRLLHLDMWADLLKVNVVRIPT